MGHHDNDRTRRQQDQLHPQRISEQQQQQQSGETPPAGQGGQTDTNRSTGQRHHERHPTSRTWRDED